MIISSFVIGRESSINCDKSTETLTEMSFLPENDNLLAIEVKGMEEDNVDIVLFVNIEEAKFIVERLSAYIEETEQKTNIL